MENVAKLIPLNFSIMREPVNWVIVVLMIAFAGLALAYIFPTEGN